MGEVRRFSGIDQALRRTLELDADRDFTRRSVPGAISCAFSSIAFTVLARDVPSFTRASIGISVAALLVLAARTWVVSQRPGAEASDHDLDAWRKMRAVTTFVTLNLYALHVALAVVLIGLRGATLLMMLVHSGMVAGVAHSLAPRRKLMVICHVAMIGLPVGASLVCGDPQGTSFAVLLLVQFAYIVGLGRRLNEEYWSLAIGQARLTQKTAELASLENQTRDLVEETPDAMGIVRDGELVFVNAAWSNLLGFETSDLIGKKLEDLAHPKEGAALRRTLHGGTATPGVQEFQVGRKDGSYATWEISLGGRLQYGGSIARPVVARDVTERNRLRAHVMVSEHLTSLGTLAAGVAHEINNPLSYVLTNIEYVRTELGGRTPIDKAGIAALDNILGEAWEGADRVRLIVRDLKAFSRVEDAQTVAVDLNHALDFAAKMTANEVRHRARFVRDTAPNLPRVLANETKLAQVFVNLLMNAAHAIPEGHAEEHQVRVSARAADDGVYIDVTDTGAGIPEHDLKRVFDPFFTTKAVGVGTGLGLSICHASVKSFGGEVSIASEVGKGTTVTLRLRALEQPQRAIAEQSQPAPRIGEQQRMLVIDDELTVGRSLARRLRGTFDVVTETLAAEALARMKAGETYDIILCDLMMPSMTGLDFLEHVTRQFPDQVPKIVFMTGGAFSPRTREFLEGTRQAVVEKPFDFVVLRRVFREIMLETSAREAGNAPKSAETTLPH